MPGLLHITLTALLASCDAFRLGPSLGGLPLGGPLEAHWVRDQNPVRAKRHLGPQLVRTQPHLVHDMGWPEIHETSRWQTNSSQWRPARTHDAVDENRGVEDEMERMIHLTIPQDPQDLGGLQDSPDPEKEQVGGAGRGDASQEGSGFYGTDAEDRDRGEDGGEERERRGGEDEWEREETRGGAAGEDDVVMVNRSTPDLDALIGYSPSSPGPGQVLDSGPQEHRGAPVLEAVWEAEQEEVQSSGDSILHSSITASPASISSATPPPPPPPHADSAGTAGTAGAAGTASPETDTGTDFSLLGSYSRDGKEEEEAERKEEEDEEAGLMRMGAFTQNPTVPEVGLAPSREPLQPSVDEEERFKEPGPERKTGVGHVVPLAAGPSPTADLADAAWDWMERTTPLQTQQQLVCLDWSELAGRGYVVLNMTHNFNCEEFRVDRGVRLLRVLERIFARRMNSPEGSWMIYLSKPTHHQHQLLMNVASENGVIATKDVLGMLGEIRKCLNTLGIQNYSEASSCHSRPSQTRSDYGKLFVVLVIIGSVCMVIITSGIIYICWQRRPPATKTTFRAEELHFVENGCHDNPMLDVTNDSQPETSEKKPSANGLTRGGEGGGTDSSRWQVFVNQAATEEEEEEQDTHL
ncbi:unnamed protein product [Ophioblennius macclurei]